MPPAYPIRDELKTLVGEQIIRHQTKHGYFEAELPGEYAGFLKLADEK